MTDQEDQDLPHILDDPRFAADEMSVCPKCGRANPPTRTSCFYCAAQLAVSPAYADLARLSLQRVEDWENGFNLIFLKADSPNIRPAAAETGLEAAQLEDMLNADIPLPLMRVGDLQEAELLRSRLAKHGLETVVVSDDSLGLDASPKRIRAVEFDTDDLALVDFNTGESNLILADDIDLIVTGILFESKTQSFEKRKRGRSQVIDQTDTSTDNAVLDIYAYGQDAGFRIYAKGFDFSCLGAEKGLLAADNFPRLAAKLYAASPNAKLIDDYARIHGLLDIAWELSTQKDFQGLRRSGFGKVDFGNLVTVSNLTQFNRWSRLQGELQKSRILASAKEVEKVKE